MDAAEDTEGSLSVDLNENRQGDGVGPYVALKERNAALLVGVSSGSGAPEAGKPHVYLTGNGRSFARDASAAEPEPGLPGRPVLLDLVAAEEEEGYLPSRFADGCGISVVCGGMNGFTDSPGPEEEEEEGTAEQGGGGPPVPGRQTRHQPPGESGGESPDSDDGSPPEEVADCAAVPGCIRTSLPRGRLTGPGRQQRCCPGVQVGVANRTHAELFPGSCDVAGLEVKVANGGVRSDPVPLPDRTRCSPEPRPGSACGCDLSGTPSCLCPAEDAPAAAEAAQHPELHTDARESSPERPMSEPGLLEDEEGLDVFSPPARPLTLRTAPGLPVSLSCDATPLSPDQDGPFYFGEDGDLRLVLEAGRRQSAPDKVPEHPEGSDSKMMPKRFGIADFFTR